MEQRTEPAWYEGFFTELPNQFWRGAVPPEVTSSEVEFIVRASGRGTRSRVLDVACGSGRHTLELARRGFRVTGLDISAEAIEHLRRTAAAESLEVDVRLTDMRVLPGEITADVAICMGNAFGYLEHHETKQFLRNLAGLLTPGGSLILDYGFVAESVLPHLTLEEETMSFGGVEASSVNVYDTARSRLITHFMFRRGNEEHHGTSVQHVYTAAEVTRMVVASGFADVERFGDLDRGPFEFGNPRFLLVARRA